MWETVITSLSELRVWLNGNQGVLALVLFAATVLLGWLSGIFSALRQKPKFKINIIDGPTFSCTYLTGNCHNGYQTHKTGLSLYLKVANVGSAPSSIEGVSVAYHWHLRRFSFLWLKYTIGWYWLKKPVVALDDFQTMIGGNIKYFPFLMQRSSISGEQAETFLPPGRSSNGIVYFEQDESFGGCMPSPDKGYVKVKVAVEDVHGKKHFKKFKIPAITIEEATKFNPSFGVTLTELNGESAHVL
ncbi:TPA: hypothetical protein RQJ41_004277 [Vibrio vulnificus]|nr:hypothetical protein [Vibrio vulnificus]